MSAAELITYLQSLPPSVNKYEAAAKAIQAAISTAQSPPWLHKTTIALAVLSGAQALAAVGSVTLLGLASDAGFWLVRTGRDGLWIPNAQILWCAFGGLFCFINAVNLSWQALIDDGKWTFKHKILIEGIRWLPMLISDGLFCHGLVVRYLTDAQQELPWFSKRQGGRLCGLSQRTVCIIVNTCAVMTLLVWVVSLITMFAMTDRAITQAIDATQTTVAGLLQAAPTYNPATFGMLNLLPLLAPARNIEQPAALFQRRVRAGWILYSVYAVTLTLLFFPFFILHLSSLLRLSGTSSLWSAMCCGYRRHRSNSTSLPTALALSSTAQAKSDVLDISTPSQAGKTHFADPPITPIDPTPSHRDAPKPFRRHVQPSGRGTAVDQASNLIWSSLLIYFATAVYCGLAIYAAASTLKDETFWKVQIIYGSGIYGCVGLIVHFVIMYRAWGAIATKRASSIPGSHPTATIGSLGIRRGLGHPSSRSSERPIDTLDTGVRVQMQTEICSDTDLPEKYQRYYPNGRPGEAEGVNESVGIASLPIQYMTHENRV